MDTHQRHGNEVIVLTEVKPLDPELLRAMSMRPLVDQQVDSVVSAITTAFPHASVELDRNAGESWATINCHGDGWALLHTRLPLILLTASVADRLQGHSCNLVSVVEDDIHARRYAVNPEVVLAVLNVSWPVELIDPTQFSIADFSWITK